MFFLLGFVFFYVSEREKEWLGVQVIWVRERGDKYHG
jgi:hypothetical protein